MAIQYEELKLYEGVEINLSKNYTITRAPGCIIFFVCLACGNLVADKDLHTRHHLTPVMH